ncbi:MAG: hypothetical protein IPL39_11655 [Opitutaceae bacterium]|nr:hypothetical protein [Opitutaceae bacterium]
MQLAADLLALLLLGAQELVREVAELRMQLERLGKQLALGALAFLERGFGGPAAGDLLVG